MLHSLLLGQGVTRDEKCGAADSLWCGSVLSTLGQFVSFDPLSDLLCAALAAHSFQLFHHIVNACPEGGRRDAFLQLVRTELFLAFGSSGVRHQSDVWGVVLGSSFLVVKIVQGWVDVPCRVVHIERQLRSHGSSTLSLLDWLFLVWFRRRTNSDARLIVTLDRRVLIVEQ